MTRFLTAILLLNAWAVHAGPSKSIPVPSQEAHDWLLHVIPLPKEAAIERAFRAYPGTVTVETRGADPEPHVIEARALAQDLCQLAGVETLPEVEAAAFRIIITKLAPNSPSDARRRLAGLKNSGQAYCIQPVNGRALMIIGLDSRGVFYGVKTLRQLIRARARGKGADATVDIPLATITDWPDLAERGLWGGSANRDIEWLSERKMNLVESHTRNLSVTDQGKGVARFDTTLIDRGGRCAVKVVPIITHLDQLQRTGLFRVFPQTLGKGDPKKWPYGGTTVKPACFSQPETAQVLADWMVSLAREPKVTDINVWLSEHHVSCACDQCKDVGQFVLEARAIARGYELAKKVRPDLKLRVLLTQGSYAHNGDVIATLPREIGITYYDGGRTYDSSRAPMIYPLLEQYVRDGGWLGCYPQLTASWRIVSPWSGPQFIRFRMTEFVEDGLQCLCGYATPDNRFYDFNVTAAAEWSWNSRGRDEREFALAYFTRKGVRDPQAAADWAVTLGPVGWDVYGSRVPYNWFFGGAARAIATGAMPGLGGGPFRYFPDEQRFADDLAKCQRARRLAETVGDPAMTAETDVIQGYVKMLLTIRRLGATIGNRKELDEKGKAQAAGLMKDLDTVTRQVTGGLRAWQQAVNPEATASRFDDTIRVTEQTCGDIGVFLARFGIDDPGRPYRKQSIGVWKTEDFATTPRRTKQWEITNRLAGPGTYKLQFVYRRGWYGLNIYRAELASAPANARQQLTILATDIHTGSAAYKNVNNVYTFTVTDVPPDRRYFITADIRGCPKESPPDRQGCEGEVFFWKLRPEDADH